jgi:hypothetical protein
MAKKQSKWQKAFSAGFTGKDMGIKKPEGQDQSEEAKEKRRKSREARRRRGN